jgi:hypothetical protein
MMVNEERSDEGNAVTLRFTTPQKKESRGVLPPLDHYQTYPLRLLAGNAIDDQRVVDVHVLRL